MLKNIRELKQLLENKIGENDLIVIAPHKGPDCDAIAAALAMTLIAKKLDRHSMILLDDTYKLENAVKCIIDELPESVEFVTPGMLMDRLGDAKALLIAVDTNKVDLLPQMDYSRFCDVIAIDHHNMGDTTLPTENLFIDLETSSSSEIMYKLLECFCIRYDSRVQDPGLMFNIANYLLAGINLDTSKFTKKTSSTTMKIVSDLMRKGADLDYVNSLFLDDFEKDKLFLDLVRTTSWKMFNIAIAVNNENPDFIYEKEDLAKAADWLMRYKTTDASFAIGLVEPSVSYISGRSRGVVDIAEIMTQLGGGGNPTAGAARVEGSDVKQLRLRLEDVIRPGYKLK